MKIPEINVGILTSGKISFTLNGNFVTSDGDLVTGDFNVTDIDNHKTGLLFTPTDGSCSFTLHNVTIGISYHWERAESQTFTGQLKIIHNEDNSALIAINILPLEDYLVSVISSEMKATSSSEFLKAHAVISRSWILAQIKKHKEIGHRCNNSNEKKSDLKWYDREDHLLFDVCADDHCQRYQGITRASNPSVAAAIKETSGMILMYENEICDARFSKCCGGVTEIFSSCWEDKDYPYLSSIADTEEIRKESSHGNFTGDLTLEKNAELWIRSVPESFCNTDDDRILEQILNNYDRETKNFYRWKVEYSQSELSGIIHRKTGTDFGDIMDIIPLRRGKSGRIIELKIIGSKTSKIIGKELEIRRTLSDTHLYSSAFVIDKEDTGINNIPNKFVITGAGWGHGVGLCQIGAAVMGEKGYDFKQILLHYYKGAKIMKVY